MYLMYLMYLMTLVHITIITPKWTHCTDLNGHVFFHEHAGRISCWQNVEQLKPRMEEFEACVA